MPRKSLCCVTDIILHTISAPGVHLARRSPVLLEICLFGEIRRTPEFHPNFPILIHQTFKFHKLFSYAYEPSQVADYLENEYVTLRLIQVCPNGNESILGNYGDNVKKFLYPYPTYSVSSGCRAILMDCRYDFPLSPKLEFSTAVTIKEAKSLTHNQYEDILMIKSLKNEQNDKRRSRSRNKKRKIEKDSSAKSIRHRYPTVSSMMRSRSASPSLENQLRSVTLDRSDSPEYDDENRPPFVVRKVPQNLIERKPGFSNSKSKSKLRKSSSLSKSTADLPSVLGDAYYNYRPWYSTLRWSKKNKSYYEKENLSDDDVYSSPERARSVSPALYSPSIRDRYHDKLLSLTDEISLKAKSAIRRHRSIEKLNDDLMKLDHLDRINHITADRINHITADRINHITADHINHITKYTDSIDRLEADLVHAKSWRYYPKGY